MMNFELAAVKRDRTGKGPVKGIRQEGMVPAVLYGPNIESTSLSVSSIHLEKLLRDTGGQSNLLNLNLDDGSSKKVLIREVQVHPYRRKFLHVDFFEVPLDKPIEVEVPIQLVGDSIGVQKGGEINQIVRTLAVRCLPNQIPVSIPVDVSNLDLGQAIHVGDLEVQETYQLVEEPGRSLVNILAPETAAATPEEGAKK